MVAGTRHNAGGLSDGAEHVGHDGSAHVDGKEREHHRAVLGNIAAYLPFSLATNNVRRRSYNALPRSQRILLDSIGGPLALPVLDDVEQQGQRAAPGGPARLAATDSNPWGSHGFKARLYEMDDRIRRNADFLDLIAQRAREFLPSDVSGDTARNGSAPPPAEDPGPKTSAPADLDKVRAILKQLVRDWSAEGAVERQHAYDPVLTALEDLFSHVAPGERNSVRLLFPGCGLGRLPWEAAMKGFSSQGNEFSMYMLVASHFILNHSTRVGEHRIYPWVGSMSNWRTSEAVLRPVQVPDVDPNALLAAAAENIPPSARVPPPPPPEFSMVAGDFTRIYSRPHEAGAWSAVCTVFFIDTARNIVEYLEVINHLLPVGGHWINLGPLLWHFEGSGPEARHRHGPREAHGEGEGDGDGDDDGPLGGSIELTLDEVVSLTEKMGFVFERRHTLPRQSYTGHRHSMLTYEYECEFWVATKVRDLGP
ncbi:unnamed protein product [Parajaminaea phylloscopi]